MKKRILGFAVALVVLVALAVFTAEIRNMIRDNNTATPEDAGEAENVSEGYSYSDVLQAVSYLASDDDMKKELSRLADPLSVSGEIDVKYVRNVFEIIGAPGELYADELYGMQDSDILTRGQFDRVYDSLVASGYVEGLTRSNVFVFDVHTDEESGDMLLSDGNREYKLDIEIDSGYNDRIINVYVKDGTVFWLNGYGEGTAYLDNVMVLSAEDGVCTILYDGYTKAYPCGLTGLESGLYAELTIDNSGVSSADYSDDLRRVRVERVSDGKLILDDKSTVVISENFRIYNVYSEPVCEESLQLLTGYEEISISFDGSLAVAAVIDGELISDDIRVILNNDDYSSYDMSRAEILCDSDFVAVYPDDSEMAYGAGESVVIEAAEYEEGDIITFMTESKDDGFKINTLSRSYGIPVYKGKIEIRIVDGELLNIINEIPLEQYLYSVVSSEMPSESHEEALKAMAICARGYAYSCIEDKTFEEYNADLDDSSLCQVYNNVEATEESISAVKATYGIVPTYGGEVIYPFYFSTSGGVTCTNSDIWGGTDYAYLVSNVESYDKEKIDLSNEDNFKAFIADSSQYDIIDKNMPYYRWQVSFTADEISEAVSSTLEERLNVSPDNIKVKNDKGNFVTADISDIGRIISVTVTERAESGVVMSLELEGTEATISVTGQTNIRSLITPVNQEIVKADGSLATGWTSLPSPFYYIDKTDEGFIIYGGGFGHGVGMSQSGANILAGEGYNYKYILRHYYSYIDLVSIYDSEEESEE